MAYKLTPKEQLVTSCLGRLLGIPIGAVIWMAVIWLLYGVVASWFFDIVPLTAWQYFGAGLIMEIVMLLIRPRSSTND